MKTSTSAMSCRAFVLMTAFALACAADDDGDSGDDGASSGFTSASASGGSTSTTTSTSGSDTGAPMVDEAAVLAQASQYATALTPINAEPFVSEHGLAASVNVFVDPANADLYRMLDPAAPTAVPFPEGTLVVKEHLDATGNSNGYLVMYKAFEGYDPAGSDWWWGRVDGAGQTQETGKVGFCIDCHSRVAQTGHIFGVTTDNRLP